MFKGFDKVKDIKYVYTPLYSSLCGVKLDSNNKIQYLLSGHIRRDGKISIGLCDFTEPWDNLSLAQKKNLNYRYEMGCECKIAPCYTVPCSTTTDNECLWTDWVLDNSLSGEQARQHACIKRMDGSCGWYQDGPPPEKDLLDLSDPWGQSHAKPTPHPSARPGTRHGSQFSNVYISYALIFRSQRLQRSVFKMFRVHLAIIMNVRQRVPIRRQMFIMNTSTMARVSWQLVSAWFLHVIYGYSLVYSSCLFKLALKERPFPVEHFPYSAIETLEKVCFENESIAIPFKISHCCIEQFCTVCALKCVCIFWTPGTFVNSV